MENVHESCFKRFELLKQEAYFEKKRENLFLAIFFSKAEKTLPINFQPESIFLFIKEAIELVFGHINFLVSQYDLVKNEKIAFPAEFEK